MQSKLYTGTRESVLKACEGAVKRLGITNLQIDADNGIIIGEAKASLISWGNKITVTVSSVNWHQHSVSVKSNPTGPQIFNWGVNDKYEESVISETAKILYRYEALYSE